MPRPSAPAVVFRGKGTSVPDSEMLTSRDRTLYSSPVADMPNPKVPPWLVVAAQKGGDAVLQQLGVLVLASAAASLVSSFVWGRMSDQSSRRVLALSGGIAALALAAMVGLSLAGLAGQVWAAPLVLFVLMLAYHGVRQGRSTYLVDMAPKDRRAGYAATANLSIGLILLATGLFGGGLGAMSPDWALAGFALMAAAGGALALTLKEGEAA